MRKLKLDLEALSVDSFDTLAAPERRGTVAGQATHVGACEGTDLTHCWGLCGESPATGLRCQPYTAESCTMDPANLDCESYAVQCEPSRVPGNCPSEPTCYYTTCRDSLTAC